MSFHFITSPCQSRGYPSLSTWSWHRSNNLFCLPECYHCNMHGQLKVELMRCNSMHQTCMVVVCAKTKAPSLTVRKKTHLLQKWCYRNLKCTITIELVVNFHAKQNHHFKFTTLNFIPALVSV